MRNTTIFQNREAKLLKLIIIIGREHLASMLIHEDKDVSEAAAWCLGKLKDFSSVPALLARVNDKNVNLQNTANWALSEIVAAIQSKIHQTIRIN